MSLRSTTTQVVFAAPFDLPGLDGVHPAGAYAVTTDDEQLDLSFPAHLRVATRIAITRGALTQMFAIDPKDLAAALQRDATNSSL